LDAGDKLEYSFCVKSPASQLSFTEIKKKTCLDRIFVLKKKRK